MLKNYSSCVKLSRAMHYFCYYVSKYLPVVCKSGCSWVGPQKVDILGQLSSFVNKRVKTFPLHV